MDQRRATPWPARQAEALLLSDSRATSCSCKRAALSERAGYPDPFFLTPDHIYALMGALKQAGYRSAQQYLDVAKHLALPPVIRGPTNCSSRTEFQFAAPRDTWGQLSMPRHYLLTKFQRWCAQATHGLMVDARKNRGLPGQNQASHGGGVVATIVKDGRHWAPYAPT